MSSRWKAWLERRADSCSELPLADSRIEETIRGSASVASCQAQQCDPRSRKRQSAAHRHNHWRNALIGSALLPMLLVARAQGQATTQPSTTPSTAQQVMSDLLVNPNRGSALPPAPGVADGPTPDASTGSAAVAPGAASINLVREGTFIVNRTGRLTRSPDGQQMEFSFDTDRSAMKDPPLLILPNLKLMQMESAVTGQSKDLRFRVSGTLTEYRGRNYVLLDKVVVIPDIDSDF